MMGDEEYKRLERALDGLEEKLGRTLSVAERVLFDRLVEALSERADIKAGKIERTTSVGKIIDEVFTSFDKQEMPKVIGSMVSLLVEVMDAGKAYFTVMGASSSQAERAVKEITKSLGLEVNQKTFKLIAGGYLESITRTTEVKLKVMKATLNAAFGESDFRTFLKDLRGIVQSAPDSEGALTRHYKTFAYDIVQRASRIQGQQMAEQIGLKAFIYSGSVIEKTRAFCKTKAGKVFTTEEAEQWKDEEWGGKNEGYTPLRDLGGHNCRHRVRWITKQEAIRRRPELKGKL